MSDYAWINTMSLRWGGQLNGVNVSNGVNSRDYKCNGTDEIETMNKLLAKILECTRELARNNFPFLPLPRLVIFLPDGLAPLQYVLDSFIALTNAWTKLSNGRIQAEMNLRLDSFDEFATRGLFKRLPFRYVIPSANIVQLSIILSKGSSSRDHLARMLSQMWVIEDRKSFTFFKNALHCIERGMGCITVEDGIKTIMNCIIQNKTIFIKDGISGIKNSDLSLLFQENFAARVMHVMDYGMRYILRLNRKLSASLFLNPLIFANLSQSRMTNLNEDMQYQLVCTECIFPDAKFFESTWLAQPNYFLSRLTVPRICIYGGEFETYDILYTIANVLRYRPFMSQVLVLTNSTSPHYLQDFLDLSSVCPRQFIMFLRDEHMSYQHAQIIKKWFLRYRRFMSDNYRSVTSDSAKLDETKMLKQSNIIQLDYTKQLNWNLLFISWRSNRQTNQSITRNFDVGNVMYFGKPTKSYFSEVGQFIETTFNGPNVDFMVNNTYADEVPHPYFLKSAQQNQTELVLSGQSELDSKHIFQCFKCLSNLLDSLEEEADKQEIILSIRVLTNSCDYSSQEDDKTAIKRAYEEIDMILLSIYLHSLCDICGCYYILKQGLFIKENIKLSVIVTENTSYNLKQDNSILLLFKPRYLLSEDPLSLSFNSYTLINDKIYEYVSRMMSKPRLNIISRTFHMFKKSFQKGHKKIDNYLDFRNMFLVSNKEFENDFKAVNLDFIRMAMDNMPTLVRDHTMNFLVQAMALALEQLSGFIQIAIRSKPLFANHELFEILVKEQYTSVLFRYLILFTEHNELSCLVDNKTDHQDKLFALLLKMNEKPSIRLKSGHQVLTHPFIFFASGPELTRLTSLLSSKTYKQYLMSIVQPITQWPDCIDSKRHFTAHNMFSNILANEKECDLFPAIIVPTGYTNPKFNSYYYDHLKGPLSSRRAKSILVQLRFNLYEIQPYKHLIQSKVWSNINGRTSIDNSGSSPMVSERTYSDDAEPQLSGEIEEVMSIEPVISTVSQEDDKKVNSTDFVIMCNSKTFINSDMKENTSIRSKSTRSKLVPYEHFMSNTISFLAAIALLLGVSVNYLVKKWYSKGNNFSNIYDDLMFLLKLSSVACLRSHNFIHNTIEAIDLQHVNDLLNFVHKPVLFVHKDFTKFKYAQLDESFVYFTKPRDYVLWATVNTLIECNQTNLANLKVSAPKEDYLTISVMFLTMINKEESAPETITVKVEADHVDKDGILAFNKETFFTKLCRACKEQIDHLLEDDVKLTTNIARIYLSRVTQTVCESNSVFLIDAESVSDAVKLEQIPAPFSLFKKTKRQAEHIVIRPSGKSFVVLSESTTDGYLYYNGKSNLVAYHVPNYWSSEMTPLSILDDETQVPSSNIVSHLIGLLCLKLYRQPLLDVLYDCVESISHSGGFLSYFKLTLNSCLLQMSDEKLDTTPRISLFKYINYSSTIFSSSQELSNSLSNLSYGPCANTIEAIDEVVSSSLSFQNDEYISFSDAAPTSSVVSLQHSKSDGERILINCQKVSEMILRDRKQITNAEYYLNKATFKMIQQGEKTSTLLTDYARPFCLLDILQAIMIAKRFKAFYYLPCFDEGYRTSVKFLRRLSKLTSQTQLQLVLMTSQEAYKSLLLFLQTPPPNITLYIYKRVQTLVPDRYSASKLYLKYEEPSLLSLISSCLNKINCIFNENMQEPVPCCWSVSSATLAEDTVKRNAWLNCYMLSDLSVKCLIALIKASVNFYTENFSTNIQPFDSIRRDIKYLLNKYACNDGYSTEDLKYFKLIEGKLESTIPEERIMTAFAFTLMLNSYKKLNCLLSNDFSELVNLLGENNHRIHLKLFLINEYNNLLRQTRDTENLLKATFGDSGSVYNSLLLNNTINALSYCSKIIFTSDETKVLISMVHLVLKLIGRDGVKKDDVLQLTDAFLSMCLNLGDTQALTSSYNIFKVMDSCKYVVLIKTDDRPFMPLLKHIMQTKTEAKIIVLTRSEKAGEDPYFESHIHIPYFGVRTDDFIERNIVDDNKNLRYELTFLYGSFLRQSLSISDSILDAVESLITMSEPNTFCQAFKVRDSIGYIKLMNKYLRLVHLDYQIVQKTFSNASVPFDFEPIKDYSGISALFDLVEIIKHTTHTRVANITLPLFDFVIDNMNQFDEICDQLIATINDTISSKYVILQDSNTIQQLIDAFEDPNVILIIFKNVKDEHNICSLHDIVNMLYNSFPLPVTFMWSLQVAQMAPNGTKVIINLSMADDPSTNNVIKHNISNGEIIGYLQEKAGILIDILFVIKNVTEKLGPMANFVFPSYRDKTISERYLRLTIDSYIIKWLLRSLHHPTFSCEGSTKEATLVQYITTNIMRHLDINCMLEAQHPLPTLSEQYSYSNIVLKNEREILQPKEHESKESACPDCPRLFIVLEQTQRYLSIRTSREQENKILSTGSIPYENVEFKGVNGVAHALDKLKPQTKQVFIHIRENKQCDNRTYPGKLLYYFVQIVNKIIDETRTIQKHIDFVLWLDREVMKMETKELPCLVSSKFDTYVISPGFSLFSYGTAYNINSLVLSTSFDLEELFRYISTFAMIKLKRYYQENRRDAIQYNVFKYLTYTNQYKPGFSKLLEELCSTENIQYLLTMFKELNNADQGMYGELIHTLIPPYLPIDKMAWVTGSPFEMPFTTFLSLIFAQIISNSLLMSLLIHIRLNKNYDEDMRNRADMDISKYNMRCHYNLILVPALKWFMTNLSDNNSPKLYKCISQQTSNCNSEQVTSDTNESSWQESSEDVQVETRDIRKLEYLLFSEIAELAGVSINIGTCGCELECGEIEPEPKQEDSIKYVNVIIKYIDRIIEMCNKKYFSSMYALSHASNTGELKAYDDESFLKFYTIITQVFKKSKILSIVNNITSDKRKIKAYVMSILKNIMSTAVLNVFPYNAIEFIHRYCENYSLRVLSQIRRSCTFFTSIDKKKLQKLSKNPFIIHYMVKNNKSHFIFIFNTLASYSKLINIESFKFPSLKVKKTGSVHGISDPCQEETKKSNEILTFFLQGVIDHFSLATSQPREIECTSFINIINYLKMAQDYGCLKPASIKTLIYLCAIKAICVMCTCVPYDNSRQYRTLITELLQHIKENNDTLSATILTNANQYSKYLHSFEELDGTTKNCIKALLFVLHSIFTYDLAIINSAHDENGAKVPMFPYCLAFLGLFVINVTDACKLSCYAEHTTKLKTILLLVTEAQAKLMSDNLANDKENNSLLLQYVTTRLILIFKTIYLSKDGAVTEIGSANLPKLLEYVLGEPFAQGFVPHICAEPHELVSKNSFINIAESLLKSTHSLHTVFMLVRSAIKDSLFKAGESLMDLDPFKDIMNNLEHILLKEREEYKRTYSQYKAYFGKAPLCSEDVTEYTILYYKLLIFHIKRVCITKIEIYILATVYTFCSNELDTNTLTNTSDEKAESIFLSEWAPIFKRINNSKSNTDYFTKIIWATVVSEEHLSIILSDIFTNNYLYRDNKRYLIPKFETILPNVDNRLKLKLMHAYKTQVQHFPIPLRVGIPIFMQKRLTSKISDEFMTLNIKFKVFITLIVNLLNKKKNEKYIVSQIISRIDNSRPLNFIGRVPRKPEDVKFTNAEVRMFFAAISYWYVFEKIPLLVETDTDTVLGAENIIKMLNYIKATIISNIEKKLILFLAKPDTSMLYEQDESSLKRRQQNERPIMELFCNKCVNGSMRKLSVRRLLANTAIYLLGVNKDEETNMPIFVLNQFIEDFRPLHSTFCFFSTYDQKTLDGVIHLDCGLKETDSIAAVPGTKHTNYLTFTVREHQPVTTRMMWMLTYAAILLHYLVKKDDYLTETHILSPERDLGSKRLTFLINQIFTNFIIIGEQKQLLEYQVTGYVTYFLQLLVFELNIRAKVRYPVFKIQRQRNEIECLVDNIVQRASSNQQNALNRNISFEQYMLSLQRTEQTSHVSSAEDPRRDSDRFPLDKLCLPSLIDKHSMIAQHSLSMQEYSFHLTKQSKGSTANTDVETIQGNHFIIPNADSSPIYTENNHQLFNTPERKKDDSDVVLLAEAMTISKLTDDFTDPCITIRNCGTFIDDINDNIESAQMEQGTHVRTISTLTELKKAELSKRNDPKDEEFSLYKLLGLDDENKQCLSEILFKYRLLLTDIITALDALHELHSILAEYLSPSIIAKYPEMTVKEVAATLERSSSQMIRQKASRLMLLYCVFLRKYEKTRTLMSEKMNTSCIEDELPPISESTAISQLFMFNDPSADEEAFTQNVFCIGATYAERATLKVVKPLMAAVTYVLALLSAEGREDDPPIKARVERLQQMLIVNPELMGFSCNCISPSLLFEVFLTSTGATEEDMIENIGPSGHNSLIGLLESMWVISVMMFPSDKPFPPIGDTRIPPCNPDSLTYNLLTASKVLEEPKACLCSLLYPEITEVTHGVTDKEVAARILDLLCRCI